MTAPEAQILSGLETLDIRDRVPMPRSVYLQIERCNSTISGADEAVFEANVRALLTMIPKHKKEQVLDRDTEYNDTFEEFVYNEYCGVQQGSEAYPFMREDEQGSAFKVKRDEITGKIDWNDPNIISPKLVSKTETDYEKLYHVIINALESANITWKVQRKTAEMGRVNKKEVSDAVRDDIAQIIGDRMAQYRMQPQYAELYYTHVINALKHAKPSIPKLEPRREPWPQKTKE